MVSKTASGNALFTATHCINPVPSRSKGNTILPDLRKLYSHPGMRTVWPACRSASAMVIRSALTGIFQPIEHFVDPIERMFHFRQFLEFQHHRILAGPRCEQPHGLLPIHSPAV